MKIIVINTTKLGIYQYGSSIIITGSSSSNISISVIIKTSNIRPISTVLILLAFLSIYPYYYLYK